MSKQRSAFNWRPLATFGVLIAVLLYLGFQAYRSISSSVDTEMTVVHSVYDSIEVDGLIYRSETLVSAVENGQPYFTVENGTRVAKGGNIAAVYKDSDSGRIQQEIEEIEQQIAAFKSISADAGANRLVLDSINEQTKNNLYRLIYNTDSGSFENVSSIHFDLLSLLSKKQLVTGKSTDFSNKISELESKKAELERQYKSPISTITAPVAGYFVDQTDGFETKLKTSELEKLTVDKLNSYLNSEPDSVDTACGKIVSGYEWYLACVLPDRYYNVLGEGKSLSLRMSFVLDEAIPATVYACNKDNNGNLAVVFKCDYMSAELSAIRKEPVEIQLVEYTGLKVPKRAIVIDEDQQAGVYVQSGNVVVFRKIEQIFSEPADYVICKQMTESGYLRLYDDIIVGGKDLYDGKIVS